MSIAYIGQSQANPDAIEDLRDFYTALVAPAITSSEGCNSYHLFQSQEDPTQFIGIEVWASIEAHQASIKNIPAESISEFMKLVAAPPRGKYFDQVV